MHLPIFPDRFLAIHMAELSAIPDAWLIPTQAFLIGALLLSFYRLAVGPDSANRIVALDLLSGITLCLFTMQAAIKGTAVFLSVSLAIAVISFLGTSALARYFERSESTPTESSET